MMVPVLRAPTSPCSPHGRTFGFVCGRKRCPLAATRREPRGGAAEMRNASGCFTSVQSAQRRLRALASRGLASAQRSWAAVTQRFGCQRGDCAGADSCTSRLRVSTFMRKSVARGGNFLLSLAHSDKLAPSMDIWWRSLCQWPERCGAPQRGRPVRSGEASYHGARRRARDALLASLLSTTGPMCRVSSAWPLALSAVLSRGPAVALVLWMHMWASLHLALNRLAWRVVRRSRGNSV